MGPSQPAPSTKPKIIVAMPAYNEEKYIGTMVLRARQYADQVIVLDDGSSDNTAAVAGLAGATVIQHQENKGYGAAIQSIFTEVKSRNPDVLVLIDADSQHNPDEIPSLIKPLSDGYDMVIGSREMQKDKIPRYRRIGQKVLLHSTRVLSGENLTDSESGFRAFSRKAIAELKLEENGMAISAETVAAAARNGLKIAEVPISINYTRDGSTLNPVQHGLGVLVRIISMISERRPLLTFGVGGVILLVAGIITGIRVVNMLSVSGVLPTGTALVSVILIVVGAFSVFTGIILFVLSRRRR